MISLVQALHVCLCLLMRQYCYRSAYDEGKLTVHSDALRAAVQQAFPPDMEDEGVSSKPLSLAVAFAQYVHTDAASLCIQCGVVGFTIVE